MKVVFFQDIEGTAEVGDVKNVKNGFARNFLLPRDIAGPVNPPNLQRANSLAEKEARRQAKLDEEAGVYVDKLSAYTATIEARVGETGRLYGSVTNRDIAARILDDTGLDVDSHIILLPEPIRDLGSSEVTIKFTRNVIVPITVDVVPDEESKEIVERLEAEKAAEEAELAAAEAARAQAAVENDATAEAPAEAVVPAEAETADESEAAEPADDAASDD